METKSGRPAAIQFSNPANTRLQPRMNPAEPKQEYVRATMTACAPFPAPAAAGSGRRAPGQLEHREAVQGDVRPRPRVRRGGEVVRVGLALRAPGPRSAPREHWHRPQRGRACGELLGPDRPPRFSPPRAPAPSATLRPRARSGRVGPPRRMGSRGHADLDEEDRGGDLLGHLRPRQEPLGLGPRLEHLQAGTFRPTTPKGKEGGRTCHPRKS